MGKTIDDVKCTLLSDNVHLWWGDQPYVSNSVHFPTTPPDFISIYLPRSKGDQLGKGATRFFPRQPGVSFCLVSTIYTYVVQAQLRPGDYFFAGPCCVVTNIMVQNTMRLTAIAVGLPANRVCLHSLRVGGLVALFAAKAPTHLMVMAGRWASESSFVQYMRATMEQYNTIAAALNTTDLVTPTHIRQLYMAP